jgi:hypothetical protein
MKRNMLIIAASIFSGAVFAGSCANYPYSQGDVQYFETPNGPKIVATGAAPVDFDNMDDVLDATLEATMQAKAAMSSFFEEVTKSEASINKVSEKIATDSSVDGRNVSKATVRNTLVKLSGSTQRLQTGVVKLSECYTVKTKVLVTVGLKPETIAAAEQSANAMTNSLNNRTKIFDNSSDSTPSGFQEEQEESSGGNDPASGVGSYSIGLDRLKGF